MYSAIVVALGLALMGIASAQRPETDIDPNRHPNLADAEAQHHVVQAWQKILKAQKDNKDQSGGHAEKATQLLEQANHELKAAAEYADHHH